MRDSGAHRSSGSSFSALALALISAALASDRAPAIAMYWNPIYRAEIVRRTAQWSCAARTAPRADGRLSRGRRSTRRR